MESRKLERLIHCAASVARVLVVLDRAPVSIFMRTERNAIHEAAEQLTQAVKEARGVAQLTSRL
jgi:hypothetical protein